MLIYSEGLSVTDCYGFQSYIVFIFFQLFNRLQDCFLMRYWERCSSILIDSSYFGCPGYLLVVFRATPQCRPIDSSDDEFFSNPVPRKCTTSRKSPAFKRVRLQSDSEGEAISLSERTVGQTLLSHLLARTPKNRSSKKRKLIDSFDANLDELLVKLRACPQKIFRQEKASNIEFLSSERYLIVEGVLTVDNSSVFPEVIVNCLNLMTLQASPESSEFGREMEKSLVKEKIVCL